MLVLLLLLLLLLDPLQRRLLAMPTNCRLNTTITTAVPDQDDDRDEGNRQPRPQADVEPVNYNIEKSYLLEDNPIFNRDLCVLPKCTIQT